MLTIGSKYAIISLQFRKIKVIPMSLRINKFARFTDTVDGHTFTYVGKLTSLKPMIEMDTGSFIITCPQEDLPLFSSATKPKNWKPRKAVSTKRPKIKKTAPKSASKPATTGSKRDLVERLVVGTPNLSRKEHIAMVVTRIGMTPAGARSVSAYATHGVLSGPAIKNLNESELDRVVVTNTIPLSNEATQCDKIEVISIDEMLTETVYRVATGNSVSELYNGIS